MPASQLLFRTLADTEQVRHLEAGVDQFMFFGQHKVDPANGPQLYFVDMDAGRQVGAHFHDVDQFQLFFASRRATYQRHPLESAMLHYTDAYATYGPFGASPDTNLHFYTLRATASSLHAKMPGSRDRLPYRGRRHYTVDLGPFEHQAGMEECECRVEEVITREPDGLAAFVVQGGPHSRLTLPAVGGTSGRCYCVFAGDVVVGNKYYPTRSLGWSYTTAYLPALRAGADGCTLLLLDYPFPPTPVSRSLSLSRPTPAP